MGRALARQALSLLGNGRKRVATTLIARAEALAPGDAQIARTRRVADLLTGDARAPRPQIETPKASLELQKSDAAALSVLLDDVRRAVDGSTPDEALALFHAVPEYLIGRGGPQLELLGGYLSFLARDPQEKARCEEAIETLGNLQQGHPEYAARHPEIDYLLAMCHDNARHFDKAVKSIRNYVVRLEDAERLASIAAIGLPPDPADAPTTDAPGESPKDVHAEPPLAAVGGHP